MNTNDFSDEDMAAVGRRLMQAINAFAPPDWHPMDCPSEIVDDLSNKCDELEAKVKALEDSLASSTNGSHTSIRSSKPPTRSAQMPNAINKSLINAMVSRFLGWKLPTDFTPDAGISFKPSDMQKPNGPHWPSGTNLLHAGQAREMIEHMLAGAITQSAEPADIDARPIPVDPVQLVNARLVEALRHCKSMIEGFGQYRINGEDISGDALSVIESALAHAESAMCQGHAREGEPVQSESAQFNNVLSAAHRLALELECLLLDTKDIAVVSKWWDSANEALEGWRSIKNVILNPVRLTDEQIEELRKGGLTTWMPWSELVKRVEEMSLKANGFNLGENRDG